MQTKQEVINALKYARRGNVLLQKDPNDCQRFKDVDISDLLVLVATNLGTPDRPFITVPYYDTKRMNLWQDFFVWVAEDILGLDLNTYDGLKSMYEFTSSVRAQGFDLRFNRYTTPMPDQVHPKSAGVLLDELKLMGSVYPALEQHREDYNKVTTIPRFNTVKAVAAYYAKYGVWVMPSEVEKIAAKSWATSGLFPNGPAIFTIRRATLVAADYSFDAPYAGSMIAGKPTKFTFGDWEDVENSKDREEAARKKKKKDNTSNKESVYDLP